MNSKALKAITMVTLSISMISGCATTEPLDWGALSGNPRQHGDIAFNELTHSVCTKAKSDPRYINQCATLMNVQRSNELNVNVR